MTMTLRSIHHSDGTAYKHPIIQPIKPIYATTQLSNPWKGDNVRDAGMWQEIGK
jgi:hypothetical protein